MSILDIIGRKDHTAEELANKIMKAAIEEGSKDNITCLTIKL